MLSSRAVANIRPTLTGSQPVRISRYQTISSPSSGAASRHLSLESPNGIIHPHVVLFVQIESSDRETFRLGSWLSHEPQPDITWQRLSCHCKSALALQIFPQRQAGTLFKLLKSIALPQSQIPASQCSPCCSDCRDCRNGNRIPLHSQTTTIDCIAGQFYLNNLRPAHRLSFCTSCNYFLTPLTR